MNTGNIANWDGNMMDIGPIYPFVGWEVPMVIIAFIFWIGWHYLQIQMENRQLRIRGLADTFCKNDFALQLLFFWELCE